MYVGKRIAMSIVDNDRLTVGMLKLMIGQLSPSTDVIWTTTTGEQAVRWCLSDATQPDVLLVDMSLEDMSGYDVCRRVRSGTARVALLGMTSFSLERYGALALESGAQCLMDKSQVKAICRAAGMLANNVFPETEYASRETAAEAHARLALAGEPRFVGKPLTKREEQVLGLCALGDTSKEIGEILGVSEPAVKTYIKRAMDKLEARNRTQAVIRWLEAREA